ncbi:MAG TPA: hypothetical protein VK166_04665, partial [Chitinophagaceae bacterium]|nr:hypothetical protein [Chitinophagaceae bacterium]
MYKLFKTPIQIIMICLLLAACKKEDQETAAKNDPPVAKAGEDVTVYVPDAYLYLDARDSHDPNNNISSYQWRKLEGPDWSSQYANRSQLELRDLSEGIYSFELQVTDSRGLTAKDTVNVKVIDEFAIGKTPVVNFSCTEKRVAWPNKNSILLASAYIEDLGKRYDLKDGFKVTQVSGPSAAVVSEPSRSGGYTVAQLSNLTRGDYVFRVEVLRKGVSAYNTTSVQVIDDTLVGKEYIFETTWKASSLNTWPSILSAEIGGRPDLFYSKLERDMQVSVKLFDHDWQDIYDELY